MQKVGDPSDWVDDLPISGDEFEPFPLVSASELTKEPKKIDWLIRGFWERGGLGLLFGDPGHCKTLVALEWAFCIAAGLGWAGYKTTLSDVIYIVGEGFSGLGRRLKALSIKYGIPVPDNLYISEIPAQLTDSQNAAWIAETITRISSNPGLIVLDTLHRNLGPGDENSAQDIGNCLNSIDTHLKKIGATVILVHHSGHTEKDRSRGSSSIKAAMDVEYRCVKTASGKVFLSHAKPPKDFEPPEPQEFEIEPVTLDDWQDDDGEPLTSVVLKHIGCSDGKQNKPARLSARDDAILNALHRAIDEHGTRPPKEIADKYGGFTGLFGEGRKVVHIDYWRESAYPVIDVDGEDDEKLINAKRVAFYRSRSKLQDRKRVVFFDGYCWPYYPELDETEINDNSIT